MYNILSKVLVLFMLSAGLLAGCGSGQSSSGIQTPTVSAPTVESPKVDANKDLVEVTFQQSTSVSRRAAKPAVGSGYAEKTSEDVSVNSDSSSQEDKDILCHLLECDSNEEQKPKVTTELLHKDFINSVELVELLIDGIKRDEAEVDKDGVYKDFKLQLEPGTYKAYVRGVSKKGTVFMQSFAIEFTAVEGTVVHLHPLAPNYNVGAIPTEVRFEGVDFPVVAYEYSDEDGAFYRNSVESSSRSNAVFNAYVHVGQNITSFCLSGVQEIQKVCYDTTDLGLARSFVVNDYTVLKRQDVITYKSVAPPAGKCVIGLNNASSSYVDAWEVSMPQYCSGSDSITFGLNVTSNSESVNTGWYHEFTHYGHNPINLHNYLEKMKDMFSEIEYGVRYDITILPQNPDGTSSKYSVKNVQLTETRP